MYQGCLFPGSVALFNQRPRRWSCPYARPTRFEPTSRLSTGRRGRYSTIHIAERFFFALRFLLFRLFCMLFCLDSFRSV